MTSHIFLNGLVGAPQDMFSFEPFFTPEDVQREIDMSGNASTLVVHITSNGGFVNDAFSIHDKLSNCGKTVNTVGEGLVASAATIILMAGKKRQLTKYGELMIHNPFGRVEGDAEELQSAADEMQRIQDKIAQFYSDKIGKPAKQFQKWMDEEKAMSSDEALELGFINGILEPMRAVAMIETNKSHSQISPIMNFLTEIKNEIAALKNQIMGTPKNLDLTTADGRTFKVDTDKNEPEVGNTATIDGQPATDGEHIIPAMNKILVVNSGKISEIKDSGSVATDPGDETDEIKNLKEQIIARDQKIGELTAKVAETESAMAAVHSDIKMIKENIASNYVPKDRTQNFKRPDDKAKPVNAFEEARNRRLERQKNGTLNK